jgi:hypothetical protein
VEPGLRDVVVTDFGTDPIVAEVRDAIEAGPNA